LYLLQQAPRQQRKQQPLLLQQQLQKSKDNAAFAISSNESDGDTRQVNPETSSSVKIQSKNLNFKSS
jgi:hypothetical protein